MLFALTESHVSCVRFWKKARFCLCYALADEFIACTKWRRSSVHTSSSCPLVVHSYRVLLGILCHGGEATELRLAENVFAIVGNIVLASKLGGEHMPNFYHSIDINQTIAN